MLLKEAYDWDAIHLPGAWKTNHSGADQHRKPSGVSSYDSLPEKGRIAGYRLPVQCKSGEKQAQSLVYQRGLPGKWPTLCTSGH